MDCQTPANERVVSFAAAETARAILTFAVEDERIDAVGNDFGMVSFPVCDDVTREGPKNITSIYFRGYVRECRDSGYVLCG
ncbi:MAG: hypothetical protein R2845_09455 [Thermomicrobiales bacterium]